MLQKLLYLTVITYLATTSFVGAQQTNTAAPIPSQITSAKTVFISNAPWDDYCHVYKGGPNQGYNSFYAGLQRWQHYQVVTTPTTGDLIFEISCKAASTVYSVNGDTGTTHYPYILLRILDPKTNVALWALKEKISPGVLAKNRDKQFDKAVVDILEQLKKITSNQNP